jgi:GAF domain-containing protein
MKPRDHRLPLWVIWSLIGGFAVLQLAAWTLADGFPTRPIYLAQLIASWIVMLILGFFASRRIGGLSRRLSETEDEHLSTLDRVGKLLTERDDAHQATLGEVRQLATQNAILQVIARTADVPLAFLSLASRISRLVACDRIALALLAPDGQEFQTYTARVEEEERRTRPRPAMVFKTDQTIVGRVIRSRAPLIVTDTGESAADYIDANVLHSEGYGSALVLPLVTNDRAVGTLNLLSRRRRAFQPSHIELLEPIAEILAVAHVAQHLQIAVTTHRATETMSELTLAIASDINSALQTIVGHCALIERGYPDPNLQRDLATITRQAERITVLLEKMRALANERMREVVDSAAENAVPLSPEAYADRE